MSDPVEAPQANPVPMSTSSIGEEIDAIYALKEKKKTLEAKAELIQEDINLAEESLLKRMDAEKTTAGAGSRAKVSVGELDRYNISDLEAFYKHIKRTGHFHLLEKRPSVTGCREMYQRNKAIQGITPFVKRVVKVTPISKEK